MSEIYRILGSKHMQTSCRVIPKILIQYSHSHNNLSIINCAHSEFMSSLIIFFVFYIFWKPSKMLSCSMILWWYEMIIFDSLIGGWFANQGVFEHSLQPHYIIWGLRDFLILNVALPLELVFISCKCNISRVRKLPSLRQFSIDIIKFHVRKIVLTLNVLDRSGEVNRSSSFELHEQYIFNREILFCIRENHVYTTTIYKKSFKVYTRTASDVFFSLGSDTKSSIRSLLTF